MFMSFNLNFSLSSEAHNFSMSCLVVMKNYFQAKHFQTAAPKPNEWKEGRKKNVYMSIKKVSFQMQIDEKNKFFMERLFFSSSFRRMSEHGKKFFRSPCILRSFKRGEEKYSFSHFICMNVYVSIIIIYFMHLNIFMMPNSSRSISWIWIPPSLNSRAKTNKQQIRLESWIYIRRRLCGWYNES